MKGEIRNIILVGFMGSGKSTVGRILAQRLGVPFVDTDEAVEKQAGMTIPEIFSLHGEPRFRDLEEAVLAEVCARDGQVIATGGGALSRESNRNLLKQSGTVVYLKADPKTIFTRLQGYGFSQRPLFSGLSGEAEIIEKIETLIAQRQPYYDQAHLTVNTANRSAPEVVEEITKAIAAPVIEMPVNLGDRSYRIWIGSGILSQLGQKVRAVLGDSVHKALLVTNPDVDIHWGDIARSSLSASGFNIHTAVIPAGEEYKSLEKAGELYDHCVQAGLDRKSPVIALGGGVIGDLAGFVAATYLRGLPFVQVPTTLLAQVDSSVGGKVAVNHPKAKNMIGAFHQPCLVLADVATLSTLPERELCAGMAEVIKHGVIADPAYFDFIGSNAQSILRQDAGIMTKLIAGSCSIKGKVVEADEHESRLRMILNFGHTVGHAVEAVSGYGHFLHGEAVSLGMLAASRLASLYYGAKGLSIDTTMIPALERVLSSFHLPLRIPNLPVNDLIKAMSLDKKSLGGAINWVLPLRIGKVEIVTGIDESLIRQVLLEMGAAEV